MRAIGDNLATQVDEAATVATEINYCLKQAEFALLDTDLTIEDRDVLSWAWVRVARFWPKLIEMVEEVEIEPVPVSTKPKKKAHKRS